MAKSWLNDSVKGFNTDVPLARVAPKDFCTLDTPNFAVTPDGNWFVLAGLYVHNVVVDGLANQFTLGHLKKYNMEGGVPVAPEARRKDMSPHGDQVAVNACSSSHEP